MCLLTHDGGEVLTGDEGGGGGGLGLHRLLARQAAAQHTFNIR